MKENLVKFNPGEAGKKMAMTFADIEGSTWWEEYVDWGAEKEVVFGEYDDLMVLKALKETVQERPELFNSNQVANIQGTLLAYGFEGITISGISYCGTEVDVVSVVKQPSKSPHEFSREALPA